MKKEAAIVMSALMAFNATGSIVSFAQTDAESTPGTGCPELPDSVNAKFELAEIINPVKIKAYSKEDALKKLPKKISIKIKDYDCTKPLYREGIYRRSIVRYLVKDTDGNVMEIPISFTAKSEDPCGCASYSAESKGGFVDFKATGKPDTKKIEVNTENFELVGSYSFKENADDDGFFVESVEKNGENLDMKQFIPDNGTTYKIPEENRNTFVLVVRDKTIPAPQPDTSEPRTDTGNRESAEPKKKAYVSDNKIRYVIKDEEGNIVEKNGMKFKASQEMPGIDSAVSESEEGYVEFRPFQSAAKSAITLDDDEYELAGYNAFEEKYSRAYISHIINKIEYGKDRFVPERATVEKYNENGFAEIPDEAVTIRVKKKAPVENEDLYENTEKPVDEYVSSDHGSDEEPDFEYPWEGACCGPMAVNLPFMNLMVKRSAPMAPAASAAKAESTAGTDSSQGAEGSDGEDTIITETTKTIEVDVKWSIDAKKSTEKNIVFKGELMMPNGVINPDEFTAAVDVEIHPERTGDSQVYEFRGSKSHSNRKKEKNIQVVAGRNREGTSVEVSKKHYSSAKNVILVNGYNYADALVSSSLSSALDAPILLTPKNSVPDGVKNEIKRLGAENIIVIGGESSVSSAALKSLGGYKIERIAGSSRYETANKVYDRLKSMGKVQDKAVLASGEGFADALSAGTIAGSDATPILLSRTGTITSGTADRIKTSGIKKIIVVGGTNSVSESVVKGLGKDIERLSGKDRYETSKKVAEYRYPSAVRMISASGQGFADALSVGGVTGKTNAPIVLTTRYSVPASIKSYVDSIYNIKVIGGSSTIDTAQFK